MALPTIEEVRKWTGVSATVLDDAALAQVLEAEASLQASACTLPDGSDPYQTAAMTQALLRRVGRHIAAKSLPLGVTGQAGEFGATLLPRWDAEIERLEGPLRRWAFG